MKVLKNSYYFDEPKEVNPYPRKLVCEHCFSELEYEKSDLRMGVFGCVYVDCPVCGSDNMLEDNEECITLTMDNLNFPVHYWHTSAEDGAVDICDNEHIRKYLREAIEYFRAHKDEYDYGGHITGNLYLNVHRWSGDEVYEVAVSKDFYTAEIPFQDEDY